MTHLREHRFILTPYNFFVYNSNNENLRTHGEHPFYHHIVNCFLLFGPNQLIFILTLIQFIFQLWLTFNQKPDVPNSKWCKTFWNLKARITQIYKHIINNLFSFFILSFLVPLIVFSLISHKEPRFLLPLVVPICLLTGRLVFGKQSYSIMKFAWLGFNLVAISVYGYMHQGGMVPAIAHVQKMFTHTANLGLDQHVIFYHTYMPPRHLIQAPFAANLINNKRYMYEIRKQMSDAELTRILEKDKHSGKSAKERLDEAIQIPLRSVYDLPSSSSLAKLTGAIKSIQNSYLTNKAGAKSPNRITKSYGVFVVAPAIDEFDLIKNEKCNSAEKANDYDEIHSKLNKKPKSLKSNNQLKPSASKNGTNISFQLITKFRFHITFEHLQEHFDLVKCKFKRTALGRNMTDFEKENYACLLRKCSSSNFLKRLIDSFSLNLYQVLL
jgi:hypothetical protein